MKPRKSNDETARKIAKRIKSKTRYSRFAQYARESQASFEMIQRHATQLAEHFANIQILATKLDARGDTSDFAAGSGDLHARVHMTGVWVDRIEGMYREGM